MSASADFNSQAARMMNSAPFGDSLTSSFFGTQAHLWGDQSIKSAGAALYQQPESLLRLDNQNQRGKVFDSIRTFGKKKHRVCGGTNCPPDEERNQTPVVNLQINRQGDVSLSDRSIDVAAPNIPGFNIPNFDFSGGGGDGINFAGDRYENLQEAGWNPFANDCDDVCREFQGDSEAYRLCKNDCEKSNSNQAAGLPWGTEGMKTILFLAVGIILLTAGLNALTRG